MADNCTSNDITAAIAESMPGRRYTLRDLPYKGVVLFRCALDATSTANNTALNSAGACVSQTPREMSLFHQANQRLVVAIGGMRITVGGLEQLTDAERFLAMSALYLRWKGTTGPSTYHEYLQGPEWFGEPNAVLASASDASSTAITNRSSRGMGRPRRMPRGIWLVDWFQDTIEIGTSAEITNASALTFLIEALVVAGPGDASSICQETYTPTRQQIAGAVRDADNIALSMLADNGGGFFVAGGGNAPVIGNVIGPVGGLK